MKVELRAVLTMSSVFVAGDVWWCEDCGVGGFGRYCTMRDALRHRAGCFVRQMALGR